jgi:adenine-specific DNA-methyltransferase
LKSGKDLNVSIESCNGYHIIDGNELALILEKVDDQIITEVLSRQPKKVIALDRIFKGNDQLKTNTALQMKNAGIEFKTI